MKKKDPDPPQVYVVGAKQAVPEKSDGRKKDGLERRQRICELLLGRGHVDVNELARQLGATPATVRRDLEKLEAEGAARRVHGGAYPGSTNGGVEVEFSLRMNFHTEAKRRIAARAAALIKNGETVYLDAGTTAFMVAQELVGRSSLAVVTNSLAAAEVLRTARGITLFVVGGRYLTHTRSLIGPTAEEAICSFQFRKMILGTAGIDYKNQALTQSAMEEVPIKRAAMSRSEQIILVADHSKFGRPTLISMIPLAGVHTVITDSAPPEGAAAVLRDLNIELVTVVPPTD
ncbi:MAG: DeoR/GlpR family DNA-binding transcription regulator [Acidobacteriia bacterium]|nr:DeoR/GlpR family DNA-binding transcription regulator [Terriglobia bacterium]